MKDIHSQINPILEEFARGCAFNQIMHYYEGHSHNCRGIDLTFKVNRITTHFFNGLELHYPHFKIRNERGHIDVVITIFEDDDMPF